MNHQEFAQLEPLLSALVESNLTATQRDDLRALLRRSRTARQYYARYMFVHGALAWRSTATVDSQAAVNSRRLPWLQRAARFLQRRPAHASLAVATVVVGMLVLAMSYFVAPTYWRIARPAPPAVPTYVAELTRVEEAKWSAAAPQIQPGSLLQSGQRLQLQSGLAEIHYHSGVKMIVEGPAQLVVSGENSSELREGKLAASVPPAAIGYTVVTPLAEIVDLGTEFGVAANADGSTHVQVFEGAVQTTVRAADGGWGKPVTLKAREQTTIDAQSRSLSVDAAVGETFARRIEPPPFVVGDTLDNYRHVDSGEGVTLIYGKLVERSGEARMFGFHSVTPGRWVTPLLFACDSQSKTYRITGVGQSIESDGSGNQSALFSVVAGSADLTAGVHTFGMFDGRVAADGAGDVKTVSHNPGVVSADFRGGPWLFAFEKSPRRVRLGRTYSAGGNADEYLRSGRTYGAWLEANPSGD